MAAELVTLEKFDFLAHARPPGTSWKARESPHSC